MQEHPRTFVVGAFRILAPALVFLLTGVVTVTRQTKGFELEKKNDLLLERVETLESMRWSLEQEIVQLKSRERISDYATKHLRLRQPSGREIVILRVQPVS